MIKIKNLKYKEILNIKNLEIPSGFVVIGGRSGLGKTTLINLIMGKDYDYEGDITFKNESIKHLKHQEISNQFIFLGQEKVLLGSKVEDELSKYNEVPLAPEKIFGKFIEEETLEVSENSFYTETALISDFATKAGFCKSVDSECDIPAFDAIVASLQELTKNIRERAEAKGKITVRRYEQGLEIICDDEGEPIANFLEVLNEECGLTYVALLNEVVILQSTKDWMNRAYDKEPFSTELKWHGNRIIIRKKIT